MQMHEDYQKIILMTPPGIKGYELSRQNGSLDGRTNQGLYPAYETAGFTRETVQTMAQISIYRFYGIGLLMVGAHFVRNIIVHRVICRIGIDVALFGLGRRLQASLERL